MNLRWWLLLSLFLSLPALADSPTRYAYSWPLLLEGEGQAWQVELTPEVYAASVDPFLRDVQVFAGDGDPVPVGPLVQDPSLLPTVTERVSVFSVRRGVDDDAASVRLRIDKGSQGAVRVDAAWGEGGAGAPQVDYLLDTRGLDAPIDGLVVGGEGAFRFRFSVEASQDLERWRTVVPAASLLRLSERDEILERLTIELPATQARYLRMRSLAGAPPTTFEVQARLVPEASRLQAPLRWVEATLKSETVETVGGDRVGVHLYEVAGPLPVERLRLQPSSGAALASVRVQVQREAGSPTIEVAGFPVMGLEVDGVPLSQEEVRFRAISVKVWRVESSPPLPAPPTLTLGYRPMRLVFLAQGGGPYLLAAGSREGRRTDAPIPALLREMGERHGELWEPPTARLGQRMILAGEAALREPARWQRHLLWVVLAAGAGLVASLAFKVLRKGAPEG